MNAAITDQFAQAILTGSLCDRLETLGVTVAVIDAEGHMALHGRGGVTVNVAGHLAASPSFAEALRRHWGELVTHRGEAISVWPGIWLVHLPAKRRRRPAGPDADQRLVAAIFVTDHFLQSDQWRLLCDQCRMDRQAAGANIDRHALVSETEVQRLAAFVSYMHNDMAEVNRCTQELRTLSQQLGNSYEELTLLYKLSTNMTFNGAPADFLNEACRELREVAGLRWMALILSDNQAELNELAGRIFTAGTFDGDVDRLKEIGRELMRRMPAGSPPLVIDDTHAMDLPHLADFARHVLVVSLSREDQCFGVLFGGDKLDGSHIGSVDSKLCDSLASSMAIFLQNTMRYEDMQAMFMGTLTALTSSIDAKDSYTRGHSERVALISRLLAQAAGIDPDKIERIALAALMHDVGKIGVPEAILCKTGKLNKREFELMQRHPEIGARILQDIKPMQDLIPGVLHHHERWDGLGYPLSLAQTEIPLFGRLIGLADAYDAMSSTRTYRRAMSHKAVIDEIRHCAGTQFDPELVAHFVVIDFTPILNLLAKHRHEQGSKYHRSA